MPKRVNAHLEVDTTALRAAFRLLSRRLGRKLKGQELVFRFDQAELILSLGDMSAGSAATGDWPGSARVQAHVIRALLRSLPEEDSTAIEIEDGRLRIGTFDVGCVWTASTVRPVEIPLDPTDGDMLKLAVRHTADEIAAAGLAAPVEAARKRLSEVIEQVEKLLKTFDVPAEDISRWVVTSVVGGADTGDILGPGQRSMDLKVSGEQLTLGDD